MFSDSVVEQGDYKQYGIDDLYVALLADKDNEKLLQELEHRLVATVNKHLAGKHDQSSHAGGKGSSKVALDLPDDDDISIHNLVSAKAPYVGLTDKAQAVAARIKANDDLVTRVIDNPEDNVITTITSRTATYSNEYYPDDAYTLQYKSRLVQEAGITRSYTQEVIAEATFDEDADFHVGELATSTLFYRGMQADGTIIPMANNAQLKGYSEISSIEVDAEHTGLALGTAMLEFARSQSPEPIFHSSNLSSDGEEFARTTKSVEKHRYGQHDQSKHAPQSRKGVPEGIDLEGKRYTDAAVAEFRAKAFAFQDAKSEASKKAMDAMKQGKTTEESRKIYQEVYNSDTNMQNARAELEDNFLFKDAMNVRDANGVRLGDKEYDNSTSFTESPENYLMRMGVGGERLLDAEAFTKDAQFYDKDMNAKAAGIRVTPEEAIATATNDFKEWAATADSVIVMPQDKLNKILASGSIKTVHETRTSTVGQSTEEYIDHRLIYENVAYGYTDAMPLESRPVSGILMSDNYHPTDALSIYGGKKPTTIILKPEVRERTTWTDNDSLNTFRAGKTVDSTIFKTDNTALKAGVWRKATGENYFETPKFRQSLTEVQIHGGVKTSDIAKVRFFSAPSASAIARLDKLEIPYEVVEAGITDN